MALVISLSETAVALSRTSTLITIMASTTKSKSFNSVNAHETDFLTSGVNLQVDGGFAPLR